MGAGRQVIRPEAGEHGGVGVHGSPHGARNGNSFFRYHPQSGTMHNGLIAVAFELAPARTPPYLPLPPLPSCSCCWRGCCWSWR